MWWLNLRTHTKLLLSFALVLLGFASLLYLAQSSLVRVRENDQITRELNSSLLSFKQIRFHVHDTRSEVLNALLVKDPERAEQILQQLKPLNDMDAAALDALQHHTAADPTLRELVAEVSRIWHELVVARDQQVIPLLAAGKFEEVHVLTTGVQRQRILRLGELASRLDQLVAQRLQRLEQENARLIEQQLQRFFLLGGVLIVLAVLLSLLLSHNLARPLGVLTAYARQISQGTLPEHIAFTERRDEVGVLAQAFARLGEYIQSLSRQAERLAQGDLSQAVAPRSDQDLLGHSFVRMVDNLSQLTQEMQEGIVVIASASEEILSTAGQVAGGAQESASAITEIATTIEEVKQTARMAQQRAGEVNEAAGRNRDIAQSGLNAVAQSLGSMSQVREQMHAMAESILRLGEQSQAISEIVATVNELAEQSNLLGVNASIEAGKAGEAGKGFAVVALEVKALAEQSKQATAQVRSILGDVQRAMTRAAMAAEQGSKAVELGFEHARSSDEAMRVLADSLAQSGEMAAQIAATSQQQLAGMDQVASAIGSLRQTSQDNAAGARQVDQSARDLHGLGGRLKRLATQFKLPERQRA